MECVQLTGIGEITAQRLHEKGLSKLDEIAKVKIRLTWAK